MANADESEPLSFKDRVLLDLQPQLLLEGMAIAAYAVGAAEGFVYIRGEYAAQAARVSAVIERVRRDGWLGTRIGGDGLRVRRPRASRGGSVHLRRGDGLAGVARRPRGLFEAPLGISLRQMIDDFGGGMRAGSRFHFALRSVDLVGGGVG